MIQVSWGLYAPDAYHDFVGFEVEQASLERGFSQTYGIALKDIVFSEELAIGTYRFSAGTLIPEASKVAWNSKRKDIEKLNPNITRSRFTYALPRRQYRKEWGSQYRQPGIFARFLAFAFRLIPTFGPFKALGFRPIPAAGERMFLRSFDATVNRYRVLLTEAGGGTLKLPDRDLDTGASTGPGEYQLADRTYAALVDKLAVRHFETASPALRANVLEFFSRIDPAKLSPKTSAQLQELRTAATAKAGYSSALR